MIFYKDLWTESIRISAFSGTLKVTATWPMNPVTLRFSALPLLKFGLHGSSKHKISIWMTIETKFYSISNTLTSVQTIRLVYMEDMYDKISQRCSRCSKL